MLLLFYPAVRNQLSVTRCYTFVHQILLSNCDTWVQLPQNLEALVVGNTLGNASVASAPGVPVVIKFQLDFPCCFLLAFSLFL